MTVLGAHACAAGCVSEYRTDGRPSHFQGMFSVHVCPQLVNTTEEVFHEDCVREGLTYGLQLGKEYLEAAHQRTRQPPRIFFMWSFSRRTALLAM